MNRRKSDRQNEIRRILDEEGQTKVCDLAGRLQVSGETIRKDLDALEAQGFVVREHGSARLLRSKSEVPLFVRAMNAPSEKQRIALEAIRRIEDGMAVYLDAGSTLLAGMDLLRSKKDLTIVVNSIQAAQKALEMDFRVIFLGGNLLKNGLRTEGYFAQEMIDRLHIDLAILGTCGIKGADGFGVFDDQEIGTRRHLLSRSDRIILIMDASKFDKPANFRFCRFDEVDELITNPLTQKQREFVAAVPTLTEV